MKKNIPFEDAQKLQEHHPDTFYAPDAEALKSIKAGDFVKVCAFRERFWAEVITAVGGKITARIDNELVMPYLKYNDMIEFRAQHVYDIISKTAMGKTILPVKSVPPKTRKSKRFKR